MGSYAANRVMVPFRDRRKSKMVERAVRQSENLRPGLPADPLPLTLHHEEENVWRTLHIREY